MRKRLKDGDDINVILQIRSSNQISEELLKAEELFQKENYKVGNHFNCLFSKILKKKQGALAIFLEILKTDPNNFKSLKGVSKFLLFAFNNSTFLIYFWWKLGQIYFNAKKNKEALDYTMKALNVSKNFQLLQRYYISKSKKKGRKKVRNF